ncbi:hypothetical protein BpHYR1_044786 [Brachionus plicatilis]|uniref:Uncharacterized protein n=1 Tax=Brachionus plicatilis TaxID=10195 RepID=A0A3M7PPX1_BRAPC|nr:hypothetical protein BpHYR1_044786 [Brachionus plicatilis]
MYCFMSSPVYLFIKKIYLILVPGSVNATFKVASYQGLLNLQSLAEIEFHNNRENISIFKLCFFYSSDSYSAAIPLVPSMAFSTSVWPNFCSRPVHDLFFKISLAANVETVQALSRLTTVVSLASADSSFLTSLLPPVTKDTSASWSLNFSEI